MQLNLAYNSAFFAHLSYLFYAIAASDGHIPRREKEEIIRLVDIYWTIKNTNFNSRDIIYENLKLLIFEKTDKHIAFENFKIYYLENKELFPSLVKEKVMESAYEIANSYARRNKSEVLFLHLLHTLLYND